jgi:HD-GYP domain-containing protein (c-di-GMP phosphodiesterase class II)
LAQEHNINIDNIELLPDSTFLRSGLATALIAVSMCVKNVQLYGQEHPMTAASAKEAYWKLTEILSSRPSISVAVTESYMAIGSFPMEDASGALSSFARILYGRSVCQISLFSGVTREDILGLAEALSIQPEELVTRGGLKRELESRKISALQIKEGILPSESRLGKDPADIYEDSLVLVEEAMRAVKAGLDLPMGGIRSAVSDSLQSLMADESDLVSLAGVRSHDRYLSEHSVNVSVLSMLLARDLGLDSSSVLELGIGALLHDVGKVFIPAEIVSKPGKLTEEEWNCIKQHPLEGARALAGLHDLPTLAPTIALQHHSYCDGTGYPALAAGEQPHLVSRLVGIVDTYDALTTDRPFRERWTPEEAVAWMVYESGTKYDRKVLARLASKMELHPIGSLVRLKNGQLAAVVGGSHLHPREPILKVLGGSGISKSNKLIDLHGNSNPDFDIEAVAKPMELLMPYIDVLAAV